MTPWWQGTAEVFLEGVTTGILMPVTLSVVRRLVVPAKGDGVD